MNIDLLNIGNPCNQNCRQCFAQERCSSISLEEEIGLAKRIMEKNDASFFIYPKEASTNKELIGFVASSGQRYMLTNGSSIPIKSIKQAGIKKIKITLFSDQEEQWFWNRNSPEEYEKIKQGIAACVNAGLQTEIYTIVTPKNISKLPSLYSLADKLGAKKINLLRLLPVGNARNISPDYLIKEDDLEELISVTDPLKKDKGPYISFGMSFGPDFYGSSVWNFFRKNGSDWVTSKTLCPVVDNQYAGVSMKTRNVYWCFLLQTLEDAKIGNCSKQGRLDIKAPDFSRETLTKKLRGNCSSDNCEYQELCLGGCRSYAYVFARLRGETEPEYAGMDICRTQLRRKLGK